MGGGVLEGYNCDGNSKIKWRIMQSVFSQCEEDPGCGIF